MKREAHRASAHLFDSELMNVNIELPICQSQDDGGGLGGLLLDLF